MRTWLQDHGRALLLLPWIGLILGLIITDGYLNYVADWHVYLQILALVFLGFTFVGEILRTSLAMAEVHTHGPDCDHGHDHSHAGPVSLSLVLAHLIPLGLFLAVGPPELGLTPDLDNPARYESAPLIPYNATRKPEYTEDGYLNTDLVRLHQGYKEKNLLPPKINLLGQVYNMSEADLEKDAAGLRDKGVKNYLFRFIMTCCAADARPLSVGLLSEEPLQLDQQSWLEVKGEPVIIEGKIKSIVLKLHNYKQVPKPPNPYLFALF